jgi:NADP-dependent 3-hydroxy acid dehydrogenase YdfG
MITLALVQNGAKVFITSRNADKLKDVAEKYGSNAPGEIIPYVERQTAYNMQEGG